MSVSGHGWETSCTFPRSVCMPDHKPRPSYPRRDPFVAVHMLFVLALLALLAYVGRETILDAVATLRGALALTPPA